MRREPQDRRLSRGKHADCYCFVVTFVDLRIASAHFCRARRQYRGRGPVLPGCSTQADRRNARRRVAIFTSGEPPKMHSNGDKQSRPRAAAYKTATGARAQLHQVSRAMELLGKFRRVARGASVLIGPTNHSAIVGGAQLWALCEIQAHPGIKVSDLATTMALHQSTVSNLLDKLLSKRLVRRQRDTVDARVVHLSVTAAGAREIGRPRFSKRS